MDICNSPPPEQNLQQSSQSSLTRGKSLPYLAFEISNFSKGFLAKAYEISDFS